MSPERHHDPPAVAPADFFVTGGTLRADSKSYVERAADRDLLEALSRGEFCYVLTARQMGKSSLMVRTANKLRAQSIQVAVIDLTAIGQNLSPEQWYDGLASRLGRQLDLESPLDDFWLSHTRRAPLQRWLAALAEVILPRVQQLVIFIDEIDTVRSLPFSTDEFFAALREMHNRRSAEPVFSRLTFCLLGVATPSDLIRDTRTTPFNIGRRIELADFTLDETLTLADGFVPNSFRDAAEAARQIIRSIFSWTRGHPYLTQRLCRGVLEHHCRQSLPPQAGPKTLVNRLAEELFFSPQARQRDDNLLFVRERLLRSDVDRAALLDAYAQIRRGKTVPYDETNAICSLLNLSGLVRIEQGHLRVRNRIYERAFDARWAETHMPEAELRRQRAAFRRGVARTASLSVAVLIPMLLLVLYAHRQAVAAREAHAQLAGASARALHAQARSGRLSGLAGQRFNGLAALRKAAALEPSLGLRNEAAACLALPDYESGRVWTHLTNETAFATDLEGILCSGAVLTPEITLRRFPDLQAIRTLNLQFAPRLLSLSPNRRWLAAYSEAPDAAESALEVWDVNSGARLLHVPVRVSEHALQFHPFLPELALGLTNGSILFLSINGEAGRPAREIGWGRPPSTLQIHPDGQYIAAASSESLEVPIWNWHSRQLAATLAHSAPVSSLAWAPNRELLAAAGEDSSIWIWAWRTGDPRRLDGHRGPVTHLQFGPDHESLLSAGRDATLRVWDLGRNQLRLTVPFEEELIHVESASGQFHGLSQSHDGLHHWRIVLPREFRSRVGDLPAVPNPKLGFTLHSTLISWPHQQGVSLHPLDLGPAIASLPVGATSVAAFHSDADDLFCSDFYGVHRFPLLSSSATATHLQLGPAHRIYPRPAGTFALSPSGKLLALAAPPGILVFEPRRSAPTREIVYPNRLDDIAVSPADDWIAAADWQLRRTLIWEARTGALLATLPLQGKAQLAFAPGQKTLAIGTEQNYQFWATSNWTHQSTRPRLSGTDSPGPLSFSADGHELAVAASRDRIDILDPISGATLVELDSPYLETVVALAFSPDQSVLAGLTRQGTLFAWNLHQLRRSLAKLGLDWNTPRPPAPTAAPPTALRVEIGSLQNESEIQALQRQRELTRLSREISSTPEARLFLERAALLREVGAWDEALNDLDRVIQLQPGDWLPRAHRAQVLAKSGRLPEAIGELEKLRQTQPDNTWVCRDLALLYLDAAPPLQNPRLAKELAHHAVQLERANYDNLYRLGLASYRLGELKEALLAFTESAALRPDQRLARNLLHQTVCHAKLGDFTSAARTFHEALTSAESSEAQPFPSDLTALINEAKNLIQSFPP